MAARIGITGLGTMGGALALNIAGRGFDVAIHNRSPARIAALRDGAGALAERLVPAETPQALAAALARPRAVLMMVPAGAAVDDTIAALLPHLDPGDILIDGGNADFHDTDRRAAAMADAGMLYLGLGVSGGEEGARHGPSLMAGGDPRAWDAVADILTAIAARFRDDPCAALLGPGGAGHFVKTVHNGIEYADMQLIAEIYGHLAHGEGRAPAAIGQLFDEWNGGPLNAYLTEITARVLSATDPGTGRPMVDVIEDAAGQKGTGRWTAIEALRLGQSASVIEAAVGARAWSADKTARAAGAASLPAPERQEAIPRLLDADLERALLAGRIVALSQGLSLLQAAAEERGWDLDLARTAEIWRAGCIIRSGLLDDIAAAIRAGLPQGKLILAPHFAAILADATGALRRTVAVMALSGQPAPALSAALAYLDTMRHVRGTANLIQAQRDYFGAHGFRRTDAPGDHHGPW
ncbi:MAG: NADP-dependent phosphogluconate dehydrogenase [Paracoccaceae bacterium]